LVVNLTTRLEGCGPAEKKLFDFGHATSATPLTTSTVLMSCFRKKSPTPDTQARYDTDTTSTRLPVSPEKPSLPAQKQRFPARFVDKLLNIHRIKCAELAPDATADFLSSFDPIQNQGLFSGLRRT
jgi:hypothetical protein